MIWRWYKVLVVAFALVSRVSVEEVEEVEEGWPLAEAQGAKGDNPRSVSDERVQHAVDYRDERLMDPGSRKTIESKEVSHQDISEGEGADEVDISNDDDEVEDLAYDSDMEKIYKKTDLKDVDTGQQTPHDKVLSEPSGRSELRRMQHWDDKPKCLMVRRGREEEELSRVARKLVTREPSMYYDMKRAKRRMLAFPRHGSEDRSSWGAKILKALETALNTAAKNYESNMDKRDSTTAQYPEWTTFTDMPPIHTSVTSRYDEPKRNTFLADHRLPLTNSEHEQRISPNLDISRTTYRIQRKQTLPLNSIESTLASSGENHDSKISDPHPKREKSFKTWVRYRDNYDDNPSEEEDEEGRMNVMPYAKESRQHFKPQHGRGQSSSSKSEELPVSAPKTVLKGKTIIGKRLRTTTILTLHRTKTEVMDGLIVDSERTSPSAEALNRHSSKKTTKRVKNFYPITQTSRLFSYESKSNVENNLKEIDEKPSSTPFLTKSIALFTKKNNLETLYEDSSEELGIELNHRTTVQKSNAEPSDTSANESSTHRADSFEVSQRPLHHINHDIHHTSSPVLVLKASEEPGEPLGRRENEEFYPGVGKGAPKAAEVLTEPAFPAPVVVSGIEELFKLPKASRPMRDHWDSFYKSVSAAARRNVSLHLSTIIFLQTLLVTFES